MQAHPALGHLAIGYSPIIDAQRAVVGCRLTLFPEKPDASIDVAALLTTLTEVWPATDALRLSGTVTPGTVLLNAVGEPMLRAMLLARPPSPLALEVPSFMLADPACAQAAQALHAAGGQLWLKGRLGPDLPATQRAWFSHVLYEVGDAPPSGRGSLSAVAAGATSAAQIDAALKQGAVAAIGWPLAEAVPSAPGRGKVAAEIQVVMELIKRIDREESIERLEAALKGDPTLAFRLLRYLNSAAFGLKVEINSFRHALMLLGYQKLKRWLALLLVSASKDASLKPVMYAAVRRGLLMEELVRSSEDPEMRNEMFICGVFSLLDRMLRQPFSELLGSVPVPERVRQALQDEQGPFLPYLELVRAIELGSAYDQRVLAESLMLDAGEINRAVLAALLAARQLD